MARLLVSPKANRFNYFIEIEEGGNKKCKVLIYTGFSIIFFGDDFFSKGKWIGNKELVLTGKQKEVETRIIIDKCTVEITNLTPYVNPHYYTMMRADITDEERAKARKDYHDSLPPDIAALLRDPKNFGLS